MGRWDRDDDRVLGPLGVDRRTALRTAGASLLVPALAPAPAAAAPKRLFFTPAEWAVVDELAEIIIPADDHSPGARAAAAVVEIDRRLGEAPPAYEENARWRRLWKEGLARVEALSRELHGAAFLDTTPEQRVKVVQRIAASETAPKLVEERFFKDLKAETVRAYYSSEIGLKQDLEYQGNSYLEEFAGHDARTVPLRAVTKRRP